MSRSQKKGPFVDERLFRRVKTLEADGRKEPLKTWSRSCTIIPEFVGHTFNGAQRKATCEGVRDRRHGRSQIGRVRSDADVPGHSGVEKEAAS